MNRATVVERRNITTGLVSMLGTATAVPPVMPLRPVGDPDFETDPVLDDGYLVVHSIAGGDIEAGAPLYAPWSEADLVYQIDSVGATRRHVEWLADRVRLTMVSRNEDGTYQVAFPHPPGWRVIRRMAETDIAPGVDVGGTTEHRVFSVAQRFRLFVVPDPGA